MNDYTYEKVEGMTVGQLVDRHLLHGELFYIKIEEDFSVYHFGDYDIYQMNYALDQDVIYTRKENKWWSGMEGSVIMVKSKDVEDWHFDIFQCYLVHSKWPFECSGGDYVDARPLTAAERNKIKVKG